MDKVRDNTDRRAQARELKEKEELAKSRLRKGFKLSSTKAAEACTQVGPLTHGVGLYWNLQAIVGLLAAQIVNVLVVKRPN